MSDLSYEGAACQVRTDFGASHSRFWHRLAGPGAWWTGPERVDIAREARAARSCERCRQRKAALSPDQVGGEHDTVSELPPSATDAVHRIVTDAPRLTRSWYQGVLDSGLTEGQYIELLGTVVGLVSIDSFCRAIGVALHELPPPRPGEISRYEPDRLERDEAAWIRMVPMVNEGTAEDDLWVSGRTGYVIRAMSLVPDEVRTLNDLSSAHYLENRHVRTAGYDPGGALSRSQMELLAARVSLLNQCYY